MTSIALADALEAYELAVACGVDSLTLAERKADFDAAHRAHVYRLAGLEEARAVKEADARSAAVDIVGTPRRMRDAA